MVNKWSYNLPMASGSYLIRDRVFGIRPTNVVIYVYGPLFFVRPSNETIKHGVPLGSTPSWWEWREMDKHPRCQCNQWNDGCEYCESIKELRGLIADFRAWHKKYFPEWYEPITSLPVFDSQGKRIGNRLIENPLLTGRDVRFEELIKRLEKL